MNKEEKIEYLKKKYHYEHFGEHTLLHKLLEEAINLGRENET